MMRRKVDVRRGLGGWWLVHLCKQGRLTERVEKVEYVDPMVNRTLGAGFRSVKISGRR